METWPRYDKVIDSFSSVWNKQSPSPITSRRLNKMRVLFEMTKNMLKQLDMYELLQRVFISRQPSLPASRMSQANFDCPVNLTLIPAYSFRVLCRACEVHFGGHCAFGAAWNWQLEAAQHLSLCLRVRNTLTHNTTRVTQRMQSWFCDAVDINWHIRGVLFEGHWAVKFCAEFNWWTKVTPRVASRDWVLVEEPWASRGQEKRTFELDGLLSNFEPGGVFCVSDLDLSFRWGPTQLLNLFRACKGDSSGASSTWQNPLFFPLIHLIVEIVGHSESSTIWDLQEIQFFFRWIVNETCHKLSVDGPQRFSWTNDGLRGWLDVLTLPLDPSATKQSFTQDSSFADDHLGDPSAHTSGATDIPSPLDLQPVGIHSPCLLCLQFGLLRDSKLLNHSLAQNLIGRIPTVSRYSQWVVAAEATKKNCYFTASALKGSKPLIWDAIISHGSTLVDRTSIRMLYFYCIILCDSVGHPVNLQTGRDLFDLTCCINFALAAKGRSGKWNIQWTSTNCLWLFHSSLRSSVSVWNSFIASVCWKAITWCLRHPFGRVRFENLWNCSFWKNPVVTLPLSRSCVLLCSWFRKVHPLTPRVARMTRPCSWHKRI